MNEAVDVRKVTFPVGELVLEGILAVPAARGPVGVVVCHPHPLNGGNMKNLLIATVAGEAAARGMPALRFNFRGAGRSTGVHDGGVGEMEDVRAAISYLIDELTLDKVDVVGYSFGARVGLAAAGEDPRVRRLVGIAPPVSFMDMGNSGVSTKPKLFVKGTSDQYASEEDFAAWYAKVPAPKEVRVISGADHFFMGREAEIAGAVGDFLANNP